MNTSKPIDSLHTKAYIVLCLEGRMPTVYHETRQDAVKEAERLGGQHPDRTFLVCHVNKIVRPSRHVINQSINCVLTDDELANLPHALIAQLSFELKQRYCIITKQVGP